MNIQKLNQAIDEALKALENVKGIINKKQINELKREEAGKPITFVDINSAMEELIKKAETEVQYYFPDTKSFKYKGKDYNVALVLGDVEITEDYDIKTREYAAKHFIQKHGEQIVDGKKYTMKNMQKAMKNFHKAMDFGTWYRDKDYIDRLAITYGLYVYIICLETDKDEITYLHNLFIPNKEYRKNYLNKEHKIDKKDIEI